MTAQGKGLTVYRGLSITADVVALDPLETDSWKINMDRPHVSGEDLCMGIYLSSAYLYSTHASQWCTLGP